MTYFSQKVFAVRWLWSWSFIVILISSCTPVHALAPVPPLGSSSLLGIPGQSEAVVAGLRQLSLSEVQSCIASGKTIYGVTVLNSNVRSEPSAQSCRVGRIPQGEMVRVTDIVTQIVVTAAPNSPIQSSTNTQTATSSGVGYTEDIQPIFERSCNACHSAVVQQKGLQVTSYEGVRKGSLTGPVVVPNNAESSLLWQVISTGKMPLIGTLSEREKTLIKIWINSGAPEKRPPAATRPAQADVLPKPTATPQTTSSPKFKPVGTWLEIGAKDFDITTDSCIEQKPNAQRLVSGELILPISCGVVPDEAIVQEWQNAILEPEKAIKLPSVVSALADNRSADISNTGEVTSTNQTSQAAATAQPSAPRPPASVSVGNLSAALGLPPPGNGDPWMIPRGGLCMEQHLPNNQRGITALAFAPDGTLFLALDQNLTSPDVDTLILYDAFHPSRSLATYRPGGGGGLNEILSESSRITGLTYWGGAIYLNRAGEVGRIPDGGKYEKLAGGFAINGPYFHANNGIVIADGYLYLSTGGLRDGYSDGPIVGVGEGAAQEIISGGNPWAARILRAPLDALIANRNTNLFETVGRGVRNPYGLTRDPAGRLWFTDNGASNVPDSVSAGDEVNMFVPGATGDASPYFGFPLALNGAPPDWYAKPVVTMPNSSAPTGISWAYSTIYFATYGVNPGLYRLGRSGNGTVAERVLAGWPLLAVTTAPDGALWIGTGGGGLYRMVLGC